MICEWTCSPFRACCRKTADFDHLFSLSLATLSDRTIGLDKRPDLTGRLVRLLSSISYPRLSRVAGELLLAICHEDPRELVAQVGYGPCAGFLVSNGFGDAFPGATPGDDGGGDEAGGDHFEDGQARIEELDEKRPAINPITGTYVDPPSVGPAAPARSTSIRPPRKSKNGSSSSPSTSTSAGKITEIDDHAHPRSEPEPNGESEMTEEEKEAEAERLFTLFDRLDRTGVIKVQNPLQQAASRDPAAVARAEERAQREEERKRVEREEKEEEEAMRELARWKAGRTRGTQTATMMTGTPAGVGAGAQSDTKN
jgi:hypothetical protein